MEFAGRVYPVAAGMKANVGSVVFPNRRTVGLRSIIAPVV
jgi:hypothetical protein